VTGTQNGTLFHIARCSSRRALETGHRGVFVIGDARSGSVKRVASSVGEGAQVVSALHAYLADAGPIPPLA